MIASSFLNCSIAPIPHLTLQDPNTRVTKSPVGKLSSKFFVILFRVNKFKSNIILDITWIDESTPKHFTS